MNKVAIAVALAAVAVLGTLRCSGTTHCDYVTSTPPSGNPLRDIHGCWQSLGNAGLDQDPYNLVAYQFTNVAVGDAGNVVYKWREVQPPNNLYPGGTTFSYVFSLGETNDGGFTPINLHAAPVYPPAAVRVTDLTLELAFQPVGYDAFIQPLRRAVCTGYGFDPPPEPCPNGLAEP